jgi:uroporphyrinogen-III decarboxylase
MTERQRFLAALKGEKTDRPAWYGDLSYYYFSLEKDGKLEDKYKGNEGYLRFHIDKGVGIYFYAPFMWDITYTGDVKYTEEIKGTGKTMVYETPFGILMCAQKYLPSTYSWAYTSHFVNNMEQLKLMLYILENTQYHANYAGFDAIDALWGEYGLPAAIPPISVSPLQKLLARWAGVETTVNLYADDPDTFENILTAMQNAEDKPFEIICASNAKYVEFAENLSSEITGKMFFDIFNADYYSKRISQLHAAGKYVGIHIDGTLSPCLSQLAGCGFDAAEAVTPAPFGDIEIEDLREAAGDIVIIGGLPGALFADAYSLEYFDSYVERLLRAFENDRKFIVGVADQVPPDTVEGRVERVREIIGK